MRKRTGTPLRLRNTDQVKQFHRTPTSGLLANTGLVHLDGLGDLVADGVDRGERRHRILEHRADRLASKPGHRVVGKPQQFGTL
ncbi:Uncharacterised protein [Mycobacterium tuberculosis]|uniref:Uncharacterized protein n=1 Tax=Mycobacterium tuberculosis TaxID=1773 RepID=A0A0T9D5K5_MYCTX|nr:hypothetical protein CAB90_01453 [Mycobacterium tuberculosis]CFE35857.1 Uncharacterised protein [Mycobacterium tuberculosis]CFR71710.1 Uncharacterised protein [Mycobacterium tuberculosis]CKP06041.1 Uncharacterised protein [Mycobacterium tuberculosis]CKP80447.1 Uncharacterised protein [Mycobacterium tuberculosis]